MIKSIPFSGIIDQLGYGGGLRNERWASIELKNTDTASENSQLISTPKIFIA